MGIFSARALESGTELRSRRMSLCMCVSLSMRSYDYNFETDWVGGDTHMPCRCGAATCSGWFGARPKKLSKSSSKSAKKSTAASRASKPDVSTMTKGVSSRAARGKAEVKTPMKAESDLLGVLDKARGRKSAGRPRKSPKIEVQSDSSSQNTAVDPNP